MESPFISVIVPVRNEHASLPALLEALFEQDYPRDCYEIIVADGLSTDGTPELVTDRIPNAPVPLRLVVNKGVRSGPGRNAGVHASTGELIVFIDGHCRIPSERLLSETARLFADTGAGCLCRPQPLVADAGTHTGKVISAARASWLGHGRDSLIYNLHFSGYVDPSSSGASYRREVFDRVGLYDERFDACEDVELNTRVRKAGIRAYTEPGLAVYYEPRSSLKGLLRQMIRYGRGRICLMRKHPDCATVAQLVPLFLLLLLLVSPLALMLPHWIAALLVLPPTLFGLAVAVASIQVGWREGVLAGLKAPAVFISIYCGLGWGMLIEFVRSQRQRRPAGRQVSAFMPDERQG